MKLTDVKCRTAKPAEKAYKLPDGNGLYLYISKQGTKSWRYNYRIHGKEKTYTLGKYPQTCDNCNSYEGWATLRF